MPAYQYSLIPNPCTEKELRGKFPWVGARPMRIPNGWLGLIHDACQEIEIILAPENAKNVVNYFFAGVRESRLRIFLQFNVNMDCEARINAIKTLLSEVQSSSNLVCSVCGKEVLGSGHYGHQRGILPDCGEHEKGDDDNDGEQIETLVIIEDGEPKSDSQKKDEIASNNTVKNSDDVVYDDSEHNEEVDILIEDKIASIKLYDVPSIQTLISEVSTKYRDRDDVTKIKTILNKLVKAGGERILMPLHNDGVEFLNQLQADFPNFNQVIDMLRGVNALSSISEVLRIPPLLLLGQPGVGKTLFAEALATGMQVPFRVIRMENQQAGAGLVGSADFWSNSKSGAVFDVLTNGNCGNPVIVVDEVDKANSESRYNPINGLYSLLEVASAKSFHDESLPDVSLDASKVSWILTANYEYAIPEPILSRVRIFEIPSPDLNQSMQVAKRIYQMLLNESQSLKARFVDELSDDVTQLVASLSPRKMRLAIENAMGKAALAGRNILVAEDIEVVEKPVEIKLGFI